MDYFKFNNNLKPEKGSFLISEPFLPDPNFERTVVLLCEHNEEGSFGFVLNKVSAVTLEDILEEVENFQEQVYIGGPVEQNTLHFIHKADYLEGGTQIGDGLYWGGNFEQLLLLIDTKQIKPEDFRFFVGYSGWGAGQLVEELKANSWIVAHNATKDLVFDTDNQTLWKTALNRLGGRFSIYSNYPTDPRLN
ncbi:YqgE/AlgH family protein [Fulvivirga sp. RKSG066]|uniref:YqgE/AlgH family protein n=1 Tax=Fulvivirga aurantia TaxID=2529383 RepID=UPI0012BBC351|nr:YqgE/AlgH family protein [Fulvivirga aurantia]MTI20664.1 YqgE/AlgH family protein [Fulvivirga aurantia]